MLFDDIDFAEILDRAGISNYYIDYCDNVVCISVYLGDDKRGSENNG